MQYYANLPLTSAFDASAYGLANVISHVMKNNDEKPIAYVSRTLAKSEKNYSQTKKEALSIILG